MLLRFTLLLIVVTLQLPAQTALTGALQGTVTDEQGGAIPNVTIELASESDGYSSTQTTDATGSFRFL